MINYRLIQEKFRGLIGFRKSYVSTDRSIEDELEVSESGIFVNDLHDLFTIKNLDAVLQGTETLVTVRTYNNGLTYSKGEAVRNTDIFVSLVDNNTGNATSDTSKWRKTTLLSEFLRQKYDFAVTQVVQRLFSFKKDLRHSKELLQQVALFDSFGGTPIEKSGSFVGYRIHVESKLLANTIRRVGIQLLEAQTLDIYLYHSSSPFPIASKTIDYINAKRFEWFDLHDFVLKKTAETHEDGYFTIGYFEADLTEGNKAINAKVNLGSNYACGSCNYRNIDLADLWSHYFMIFPVRVQSQFLHGLGQSWMFDDAIVYEEMNWGLNLVFSVECDFTEFVIRNRAILTPALCEQLRLLFLNSIANTQRKNQDAIEAAALANHWLQKGDYEKALQKAIENASFDLSDIDKNCLPCDQQRNGIKHSVVW